MRNTPVVCEHLLADYQHAFARYLLTPVATAATRTALQQWLAPSAANDHGLAVYRNNVLYSLTAALAAQFPVVQRLVGNGFFAALARDFICALPPTTPSLTFYGDSLPAFLAQRTDCEPVPYLADVARLELACQYALHAADIPPLQAATLLALPPEQLPDARLPLHDSATLLHSRWPVQCIREENLRDEPQLLQLDTDSNTHLLIYRRDMEVQIVTLQLPAFWLLHALHQGQTLQQAWDCVQQHCLGETGEAETSDLVPLLVYLLQLEVFIHPDGINA
jgi:hypothetical protein